MQKFERFVGAPTLALITTLLMASVPPSVAAQSHDEVTELVRALPAWGVWGWKVTPLESFANRADLEKKVVQQLRAQIYHGLDTVLSQSEQGKAVELREWPAASRLNGFRMERPGMV